MQKVAPTHNSVKNNEYDVTYVLKEPRRRCLGMSKPHLICHIYWHLGNHHIGDLSNVSKEKVPPISLIMIFICQ
jgi:hypothetical protein